MESASREEGNSEVESASEEEEKGNGDKRLHDNRRLMIKKFHPSDIKSTVNRLAEAELNMANMGDIVCDKNDTPSFLGAISRSI